MTTLATIEVERAKWSFFFDAFSRQHQGWLATVEVFGKDVGAQIAADALPFVGVSVDEKDEGNAISLTLGASPNDHVTHVVEGPVRVMFERGESDHGAFEVLAIEASDGTETLLRFKAQVLPEMLDGLT